MSDCIYFIISLYQVLNYYYSCAIIILDRSLSLCFSLSILEVEKNLIQSYVYILENIEVYISILNIQLS